jgi:hypothetical protein
MDEPTGRANDRVNRDGYDTGNADADRHVVRESLHIASSSVT